MRTRVQLLAAMVLGMLCMLGWMVWTHDAPGRVALAAQQSSVFQESEGGALLINYQGRLLDAATGQAKPDGAYNMLFALYSAASGGTPLWSETKSVPVNKGLFRTFLGDTAPLIQEQFNGEALFLGVTIGADPETSPRQQLVNVPYAIFAHSANFASSAGTADSAADAEKLQGQAASAFAKADHTHSALPIAYGTIQADGTKTSGTANIVSSWNASFSRYEIKITNEDYFWLRYSTLVTPMSNCAAVRSIVGSVGGYLLVEFQNSANSNIQCYFQFVTFKQ